MTELDFYKQQLELARNKNHSLNFEMTLLKVKYKNVPNWVLYCCDWYSSKFKPNWSKIKEMKWF